MSRELLRDEKRAMTALAMNRIHIVGRRNHGKTSLIVELIEEFTRRGLQVGAIKHSSHSHELDTPGKDSHRQRLAGASPVATVAANLIALHIPRLANDDFYRRLAPMFAECDVVLVEGHVDADAVKIEVWRAAAGGGCLASERADITAVVTDDTLEVGVPVWPRGDVTRLAHKIARLGVIRAS